MKSTLISLKGIASEELDNVFEAFVQSDSGRQSQEGTGLGLPISRKFMQMMGGDLTVNSQVGRGSVFSFWIQAKAAGCAWLLSRDPAHGVRDALKVAVAEIDRTMIDELLRNEN